MLGDAVVGVTRDGWPDPGKEPVSLARVDQLALEINSRAS